MRPRGEAARAHMHKGLLESSAYGVGLTPSPTLLTGGRLKCGCQASFDIGQHSATHCIADENKKNLAKFGPNCNLLKIRAAVVRIRFSEEATCGASQH